MARSALLHVMVQAAMKAGKSLARDFGEVQNLQVSVKGPGDFVSQADLKAEKIVYDELMKARPDLWLSWRGKPGMRREPMARTGGSSIRWMVRPISCTAFRSLRFPSLWNVMERLLRALSSIRRRTSFSRQRRAAARSSMIAAFALRHVAFSPIA